MFSNKFILLLLLAVLSVYSSAQDSIVLNTADKGLKVQGTSIARAPVTRAQITFAIELKSQNFNTPEIVDILKPFEGPYGKVSAWPKSNKDDTNPFWFANTVSRRGEATKCSSCIQSEITRRATSVFNYLNSVNVTYAATHSNLAGTTPFGMSELRTTSFSVNPDYDYSTSVRALLGYTGRTTVTVQVPTALTTSVLDGVLTAGATNIDSVSMIATETDIAYAQLYADQQAALNAAQRAKVVLDSLGMTGFSLGSSNKYPITSVEIQSLNSGGGNIGYSEKTRVMAFAASDSNGGSTAATGEDVQIKGAVNINVDFSSFYKK